ncbi:unnamed protein product [Protopolystoma xenopodis]|uniref:Uncharacterized protein n=1 Tax=Protopolystoma xenopodis TaxID=117903 RepID=A0A448WMQ1_9PLAT|nr:unnamed protein product [Protopolystoma xenopodis]
MALDHMATTEAIDQWANVAVWPHLRLAGQSPPSRPCPLHQALLTVPTHHQRQQPLQLRLGTVRAMQGRWTPRPVNPVVTCLRHSPLPFTSTIHYPAFSPDRYCLSLFATTERASGVGSSFPKCSFLYNSPIVALQPVTLENHFFLDKKLSCHCCNTDLASRINVF